MQWDVVSISGRISRLAALAAVAALVLASIGGVARPAYAQTTALPVVATFSVLGDIVRNVGGDLVDVRVLVGSNGDVHSFQPTPADGRALANAALLFENGLSYETWLDPLYRAARSSAERVVVTRWLDPLPAPLEGHRHGDYDPHLWHDVTYVGHMALMTRDALMAADPTNAESYARNTDAYLQRLYALDEWVFASVAAIAPERRLIVTPHNSFAYFARRYGFTVVGTALESVSTEAQPSAEHVADLVRTIRASGAPAIFPENVGHTGLMTRIASEAGVTLAEPLYTDALGEAPSYEAMVEHNVSVLVRYLGQ